eukprot:436806-Amphidinium_carterae.2
MRAISAPRTGVGSDMAYCSAESGYHVAPRAGSGGRTGMSADEAAIVGTSVDDAAVPGGGARTGTTNNRRSNSRYLPGPGLRHDMCVCVVYAHSWHGLRHSQLVDHQVNIWQVSSTMNGLTEI